MDQQTSERDRAKVLRYLFDQDKVASSRYWNGHEIAEGTGLSLEDVAYHLEQLGGEDRVDLIAAGGEYSALIKPAGKRLVREGPRAVAPSVAIGTIIHQMSGGIVQGVGSAVNS